MRHRAIPPDSVKYVASPRGDATEYALRFAADIYRRATRMRETGTAAATQHSSAQGTTRTARKDVAVFTRDDDFLLSIGPAIDDRYRSRPSDGMGAWADPLRGRSGVALIDAASVPNAAEIAHELETEHPTFAVVVVAAPDARDAWRGALSRGSILRLLDRSKISREVIASALELTARPQAARGAKGSRASGLFGMSLPLTIAIGIAAVLAVGAGVRYWLSDPGAAPVAPPAGTTESVPGASPAASTPTSAAQAAAPAAPERSVPELLSDARGAFADRHYIEPAGNSALALYARALTVDPASLEAADGVSRVVAVVAPLVQADVKAGRLEEAARIVGMLRTAAPANPTVAGLEQDLAAARPKWMVQRARQSISEGDYALAERQIGELAAAGGDKAAVAELRRSVEAARRNDEVSQAVAAARDALAGGNLLDASANGVKAKWAALVQLDRRNPQVVAFQREYQAGLVKRGREATKSGEFDSADRYFAAAADLGNSRDLTEARKELTAARDTAAQDKERAAAAALQLAAAQQAAPAPRAVTPPKIRKRVSPDYPTAAARDGVEGFVILAYSVTAAGRTADIVVTESSPPGVFDRAARNALASWRFEPVPEEDVASLPRMTVRLSFKLGDKQ
jgi:protein TonB